MGIKSFIKVLIFGAICLTCAGNNVVWASQTKPLPFNIAKNPRDVIVEQWKNRSESISLGRDRIGGTELDNIRKEMIESSLKNIPEISILLLKEIRNRKGDLTPQENVELAERALLLSPDIPAIRFKLAALYLHPKTLHPFKALNKILSGMDTYLGNVDYRLPLAANLLFFSAIALAVTLLVFIAAIAFKYSNLLYHLARHITPKAISGLSLTLILLCIPVFSVLILGRLGIFVIFVLYFWLFLNLQEKLVTALTMLFLIFLPLLFYLPVYPAKYYEGNESHILKMDFETDYDSAARRLAEMIQNSPEDTELKFNLALIAKRAGNPNAAAKLLSEIIKQRPNWNKPYINLGNIDYIRGKIDSAIANYTKAASLDNSNFLTKYNLGKAYYRKPRLEEANAQLKLATGLDPEQFNRLEAISDPRNPVLYVFDETLSREDLKKRLQAYAKPDTEAMNILWQRSGMINLDPLASSILFSTLFLLVLVLGRSKKAMAPPQSCSICGISYCKRCSKIMDRRNVCPQCYFVFISRDSIDPNYRARKELEEKRYKRKIRLYRNTFSYFIPGFGHLYSGRALAGCFAVAAVSFSLALLFVPCGVVSDPFSLSLKPPQILPVLAVMTVAAVYLLTIFAMRRSK